jgi:6-phosphofructo-2-kinase
VQGTTARTMACDAALADLLEYMRQDGVRVAAFDATNSTKERRKHILHVLKQSGLGAKRMFVESICDEEDVRIVCCPNLDEATTHSGEKQKIYMDCSHHHLVSFPSTCDLLVHFSLCCGVAHFVTAVGGKHPQGETLHSGLS